MARNEEKANAMMNKWVTMKEGMAAGSSGRRPFLASDCDNLSDALRWRRDILRDLARKITEIQNAGLGEHVIRDLNDEINKLIRIKLHWERRIRQLGGPTFNSRGSFEARQGQKPPGSRGHYMYFGAAKNLPGVRELFEEVEAPKVKRTRASLYKNVTPDYYGYRDEDDGNILELEARAEKRERAEAVQEWRKLETARKKARLLKRAAAQSGSQVVDAGSSSTEDVGSSRVATSTTGSPGVASADSAFKSHVAVPSQEDMTKAVVARKKAMILAKYTSKGQQAKEAATRKMLNIVE